MSFELEQRAIEVRFKTQWALTAYSDIPIMYENVPAQPPTNKNAYVALTVLRGEGQHISLGKNPLNRYAGVIAVQIFLTVGQGAQKAAAMADAVAGIFRRQEFSSGSSGTILCRVPSLSFQGIREGWYQTNVNIPYERDKVEA